MEDLSYQFVAKLHVYGIKGDFQSHEKLGSSSIALLI